MTSYNIRPDDRRRDKQRYQVRLVPILYALEKKYIPGIPIARYINMHFDIAESRGGEGIGLLRDGEQTTHTSLRAHVQHKLYDICIPLRLCV